MRDGDDVDEALTEESTWLVNHFYLCASIDVIFLSRCLASLLQLGSRIYPSDVLGQQQLLCVC